jgi:hypothetical protein
MSRVFDETISRQSPPSDPAHTAAVISDSQGRKMRRRFFMEQRKADADHDTRVDPLHQSRHQRDRSGLAAINRPEDLSVFDQRLCEAGAPER